jgi:hypothetical protein
MKYYCSVLFGNPCEVCLLGAQNVVALTALPSIYEDTVVHPTGDDTFSQLVDPDCNVILSDLWICRSGSRKVTFFGGFKRFFPV